MKMPAKFTIPVLLLMLNGCAHHSGYYSGYSGSSDYHYGLGVTSYDLYPSYGVHYDRHVYINPPIIHQYNPYSSDHGYHDRHYYNHNKHKKPTIHKHFSNNKYPTKKENYSINNRYQKHQKPQGNNYFSTNKHSNKGSNHSIKNYSIQRKPQKHKKQIVNNYIPNKKYSNKAKNYPSSQFSSNKKSYSSGSRYNKHSRVQSSRKMISGKNYKR